MNLKNKRLCKQMAAILALLLLLGLIWGAESAGAAAKMCLSQTKVTVKPGIDNERKISIRVGDKRFVAELYDNRAARKLLEHLPMTITMDELNGNEKYYYLKNGLPQSAESVGTIRKGDLMLFGADCLVLFYEDFKTSYSYTKLGKINNSAGLAQTLGRGHSKITFTIN